MKTKFLSVIVPLLWSFGTIAQTIADATVVALIPLGDQCYSIISLNGSDDYYKSSVHPSNELYVSQAVQLEFSGNGNNTNRCKILAPTVQSNIFCHLIQPNNPNTSLLIPVTSLPILEDGILFFDDTTQMRFFYELIEVYVSKTGSDIDEVLDYIEAQFIGYKSFRTEFNEVHNWLNGTFSAEQIERVAQLDFINDEIEKTMLNENKLIGVGDSIYRYHQSNVLIAIHKNYLRGRVVLQNLPDDYRPYDHGSILLNDTAISIISELYTEGTDPKGVAVVTDSLEYYSTVKTNIVNCDAFSKLLAIDITEFLTTTSGLSVTPHIGGTLTIDWGDGSPDQIITDYESEWIQHTYPETGTYYPTTTYTFNDLFGNTQELIDGTLTDGLPIEFEVNQACSDADKSIYTNEGNVNWLMTTKCWVEHNFLFKRIGGYTHAWKGNGDGTYDRHKADIYVSIDGIFRDFNCVFKKHEDGYNYQHLQKKVQKTKIKLFKYFDSINGDVHSRHYMVKGSTFFELINVINPC